MRINYNRFGKMKRILIIIFVLVFAVRYSYGQVKVQGVIRDDNTNEVLLVAAVVFKGTSVGGVTGINGIFEFTVPDKPAFTIVVSYLGYITQEFIDHSA